MADRLYVKPKTKSTRVPNPFLGEDVPPDGMWVGDHQFWHRRFADGSLFRVPDDQVPDDATEVPPAIQEQSEPAKAEASAQPTSSTASARRSYGRRSDPEPEASATTEPTGGGDATTTSL